MVSSYGYRETACDVVWADVMVAITHRTAYSRMFTLLVLGVAESFLDKRVVSLVGTRMHFGNP